MLLKQKASSTLYQQSRRKKKREEIGKEIGVKGGEGYLCGWRQVHVDLIRIGKEIGVEGGGGMSVRMETSPCGPLLQLHTRLH